MPNPLETLKDVKDTLGQAGAINDHVRDQIENIKSGDSEEAFNDSVKLLLEGLSNVGGTIGKLADATSKVLLVVEFAEGTSEWARKATRSQKERATEKNQFLSSRRKNESQAA